ncbi:uncharacterized protein Dvar_08580 [Desulfosarcina variabilis str. Montpellier]|uniref:hypothetical protein n=1 Tax=Desulfosarcina variabilis TaxID=2300 RepID=UPI003AFADA48
MHQYGSFVLGASRNLLHRSGQLLSDLGALSDFIDQPESAPIDWAELKRQERTNNLKIWWEKKKRRSELMRSLAKLYKKGRGSETLVQDTFVITELAKVFNSQGQKQLDFDKQHKELAEKGFATLLPWRHIIFEQIQDGTNSFEGLKPIISDSRKDQSLRFQFLIELTHNQYIEIKQDKAFGEIRIEPKNEINPNIILKDQSGNHSTIDWLSSSKAKQNLALKYLKENKVILYG